MAFVAFEPQYKTGIEGMDNQHAKLIELINNLYEAMKKGKATEESERILKELLEYANVHFRSEETYLEQMGYPGLADHRKVHQQLMEQAQDYRRQFESGDINTFSLLHFLKQWLMTHIAKHDVAYAKFLSHEDPAETESAAGVAVVDRPVNKTQGVTEGSFPTDWFFTQVVPSVAVEAWACFIDQNGIIRQVRKSDKLDFPIQVGTSIHEPNMQRTVSAKAWGDRKRYIEPGDPTLFGIEYIAIASPIFDVAGEFAGVLTIVHLNSHNRELKQGVVELESQFSTLDTLAHDLALAASETAEVTDRIAQRSLTLREESDAMKGINDLIREVASQTNLLGLNAAIEAARAGDLGRGFGVVASEIRRLADTVKSSVQEIASRIDSMQLEVREISDLTQGGMASSEEQAAQLQELSASVATVYQVMKDLKKLAE